MSPGAPPAPSPFRTASASLVLSSVLGAAAAASSPGCYGATEVRVVITTTAPCDAGLARGVGTGIETQIYTGTRGDPLFTLDPTAETRDCTPTGEPRIGTLSVVPSGDRDGRFDLEVVAGIGVPASNCSANGYQNCIVARRRVGFRPHQSLQVPVLLSDRCIGKPCGTDETCDLGECTKTVECLESSGCPRERGEVPAPAPVGAPDATAPIDATVDAQPVDGPFATPCSPTTEILAGAQNVAGPMVLEGGDLVYANIPDPATATIRRVSRSTGVVTVVAAVPNLRAVTAGGSAVAWTHGTANASVYLRRPNGTTLATTSGTQPWATDAIGLSGFGIVGLATLAAGSNGFASVGSNFVTESGNFPGARSPEVLVDEDGDWFTIVGGALLHYTFDGTRSTLGDYITMSSPRPDFAVASRAVFVAFGEPAARKGIHQIARAQITPSYAGLPLVAGVLPRSIATDGTKLYWMDGPNLARIAIPASATPLPETFGTVAPSGDRLVVDAECIYWTEEGGTRIMRRSK